MAPIPSIDDANTAPELRLTEPDTALSPAPAARARVVVCLPSLDAGSLQTVLGTIAAALPGEDVQVATPEHSADQTSTSVQMISYTGERSPAGWVLTAADYAAAGGLAGDGAARIVLLLGDDGAATHPERMQRLVACARNRNVDLVLPRFTFGPGDGLVNSALLYPLTRALFGTDIRFPLPTEVALSTRMLDRLASISHRQVGSGQGASLIWPVAEAAIAGFSVRQIEAAAGRPVTSGDGDFNSLFNSVAGSLFSDIEAKASFWQRARNITPRVAQSSLVTLRSSQVESDIQPMIESFQLAQANLQEIWSLVLTPQSRVALKKLSLETPADFVFEPSLWARVTYDFVLAFHLRTLNRGHLLGALIPLYLAWVASHLRAAAGESSRATRHIDDTLAAFESEKSYLVARWRWPDRFNP